MEANRAVRDRLTKQWQERQTQELEQLTRRRRSDKEALAALQAQEGAGRTALEKGEQDGWWDIADEVGPAAAAALERARANAPLLVEELLDDTAHAADGAASPGERDGEVRETAAERRASAIVSELTKTDDQVLCEMEEEIQNVLESLNPYSALRRASEERPPEAQPHREERRGHADPVRLDRQTARAEREVHTAISATADRLRIESQRRQQKKQALWQQFDQWERRALGVGK
ncbi:hypothetical protein STCU_12186 [Strigomonas culicis]|uniref:Uncharacterized protein n=1 Tax=Strigomonas culicis TaxID=28005 RepID=S9TB82_9TRYP|nr:hypothetical protein STCU_12186 [Strigomonas culicis]|eukprot:EPY15262.1 hypothetical protein STCU_12186 [Strigomonas culicis]